MDGESQPATFIFSGTAALSPELTDNPRVTMLPDQIEESYERLEIYVQRGDTFRGSKSAFTKAHALEAAIRWIEHLLPQVAASHHKVLLVTYQIFASDVWNRLSKFHNLLIPYIDSNGNPQAILPYFGGLNGSNRYQEATCVVCLGLNRFEPRDYLSRAIALDATGERVKAIQAAMAQ